MKKWKLVLLASASGAVLAGSAFAADLPRKGPAPVAAPAIPYINWTGFYIGGHVGVGTSNSSCGINGAGADWGCDQWATFGSVNAKDTAGLAGIEIGYDWQSRYAVFGVAADWSWTGLKKTVTGGSGSTSYQAKINWLASFRGRAGLAVDATLIYLTGGLALAGAKDTVLFNFVDTFGAVQADDTRWGWVVGAGVEHRFSPNWSVKFEYLHYELQEQTIAGVTPSDRQVRYRFDSSIDVARVGVNYRFNQ
jgi:outer membrane immunogenic protein